LNVHPLGFRYKKPIYKQNICFYSVHIDPHFRAFLFSQLTRRLCFNQLALPCIQSNWVLSKLHSGCFPGVADQQVGICIFLISLFKRKKNSVSLCRIIYKQLYTYREVAQIKHKRDGKL
jgi:hypothetical protein